VVAVFDELEALEGAVYELETRGFDRAAFSVLAGEDVVEQKMSHRYQRIKEVEDDLNVPRATFFSRISRLEAEFLPAPALAAIGVLALAGAGTLPVIVAAGSGAVVGAVFGRWMHEHNAKRVQEQLERGGLLLWVNVRNPHEEQTALEVLHSRSAHDVHTHLIPA
jgi:hypothetical protein